MESLYANQEPIDKFKVKDKLDTTLEIITYLIKEFTFLYPDLSEVEEFKPKVDKMNKCLLYFFSQLKFLGEAILLETPEAIYELKHKYLDIRDKFMRLNDVSDISLVPLATALNFLLDKLLPDVKTTIEQAARKSKLNRGSDKFKEIVADLEVMSCKLDALLEYLPDAAVYHKEDLFTEPRDSPTWKELYQHCQLNTTVPKDSIRNMMKLISRMMTLANAAMSRSENDPNASVTHFSLAAKMLYYLSNEEEAKKKARLYLTNPHIDSMIKLWCTQDLSIIKKLSELMLPYIQYDQIVYFDKLFPRIDKEFILKEYENGTINKITPTDMKGPDLSGKKKEVIKGLFEKKPDKVKVRILSPKYLTFQKNIQDNFLKMVAEWRSKLEISRPYNDGIDGIIFHVHGGGFVAMSSATHRNHTIPWAKSLNKVIFSVDYGLAPAHPYPEGLDDVWQAYNWVINYAESILDIKVDKIIVAGDSAGGNLVTALTLMAIKMGIRVPDACYLLYPSLNLYQMYTPSYFLSIDDPLLPFSCLKLILKSYVPEEFRPKEDPFLSPIYASDELLEKLPPIRIATGDNDPLHDDSWRFLYRLVKLKRNVKMHIYQHMPHGFLSMDQLENFELLVSQTIGVFRELFELK